MCVDLKRDWLSTQAVNGYDIHIYFETDNFSMDRLAAQNLAYKLQELFGADVKNISNISAGMGPHASDNIGVNITAEGFGKIVAWLQLNNENIDGKNFSILIHLHTGDTVKDHMERAIWLGKPIAFNDFFATFKAKQAENKTPENDGPIPR